ncbi:putative carboxylesterase [Xylariomycetidae sp. FL0641]|nr:putative carboxylesterase [Xylariomycetidae sp. FL0641]
MRSSASLLALLGSALAAPARNTTGGPVVDLGYARYRGGSNARGVDEFLGLRFAAPPVGDLRWRAPADPAPTEGVQDATKFGATCVGQGDSIVPGEYEEDCLFLNVFTPANATNRKDAKLPVWVFIMGGGWQYNGASNKNGTDLIANAGLDVVHVNMHYRVAQLGFLGGLEVGDAGDYNVGVLDVWKSLQWIHEHIEQFGGDPDHVVLHGTSAGGGMVSNMLTAYGGEDHGLFAGVIGDAVAWNVGAYPNDTQPHFDMFSAQMGCANATDQMACLRAVDAETVLTFDRAAAPPAGVPTPMAAMWFEPLIDGGFVPAPQQDLFAAGRFVKVPAIVGDATNEGNVFAPNLTSLDAFKDAQREQYANLSDVQIEWIAAAYEPPVQWPQHALYFSLAAAAMGEAVFICPGQRINRDVAQYLAPNQTWNYRWNTTEDLARDMGYGAYHVSDSIAVFGPDPADIVIPPEDHSQAGRESFGYSYLPGGENAAIVPVLQHYFISFIKHLDPNVERYADAPLWEEWGTGDGQRLLIQTNETAMEDVPRDQVDRCHLWWGLNYINKQ